MKPCHVCTAPGIRDLGRQGYCTTHLDALYAGFDPGVFAFNGIGRQDGRLRPDWGPGYADLRCNACDATWVGVVGEGCGWCADSYDLMLEQQAELALRPPDVPVDDRRYRSSMLAWAARMAIAVAAGIVTQRQADTAWTRGPHGSSRRTAA